MKHKFFYLIQTFNIYAKYIIFGKPQINIQEEKNLIKVIRSNWIEIGPLVSEKFRV